MCDLDRFSKIQSHIHYPLKLGEIISDIHTYKLYVKFIYEFVGILVSQFVEIPHLCDCSDGATVALSHRYVWENHKFQNVISYDIYMLSFQNLEKLLQTLLPKNNGKWLLLLFTIKP